MFTATVVIQKKKITKIPINSGIMIKLRSTIPNKCKTILNDSLI